MDAGFSEDQARITQLRLVESPSMRRISLCGAFSPDGQMIAAGSEDGTLKIWNVSSVQKAGAEHLKAVRRGGRWYFPNIAAPNLETATLKGHSKGISSVAFSPDGKCIVSGSSDATVRVWDAETGEALRTLTGHSRDVSSVAFSPDGNVIASGSLDGALKIWQVGGTRSVVFAGHSDSVVGVSFSPEGERIASCSWDGTVKVWDAGNGRETLTLKGHSSLVLGVSFSSDGARIASCGGDKIVKVWDAQSGEEITALSGHQNQVNCVAFSPDCSQLLSGADKGSLRLWDLKTYKDRLIFNGTDVWGADFSPDGRHVVADGGTIWDARTLKKVAKLSGDARPRRPVFGPHGQRVIGSTGAGNVVVWDAVTGKGDRA